MSVISNDFEYSCTIRRASQNLDFSAFLGAKPELTIGLTDVEVDTYREITLSPDEARQLREHLNDPIVQAILGGENV